MTEYQRKKNNPYHLPHALYMQTVYAIRDYHRLKDQLNDKYGLRAVANDGQPHGTGKSDPTAQQAMELYDSYAAYMCRVIDDALLEIPEEYRRGVWDNIQSYTRFPDDAHRNTYGRWKARFIYIVSQKIVQQGKKQEL